MITLYGSPKSSAGRCVWALEEATVPYNLKEIDMRNKEHKSSDYLKINPMGKVPALVDKSTTLFESMAINYYIADTYKNELLGTSSLEKGLSMQWSFWASSELQPPIIEVFIQKVFIPEEKRDSNIIEKSLNRLPTLLKVLDDALVATVYIAGENFTIGDINTASVVSICPMLGVDLGDYKNISRWLEVISERPAFQRYQEIRNK